MGMNSPGSSTSNVMVLSQVGDLLCFAAVHTPVGTETRFSPTSGSGDSIGPVASAGCPADCGECSKVVL